MSREIYELLIDHVKRMELLVSTAYLLTWDQETLMPRGGGAVEYRARQLAQLARLTHERRTDPRLADWLAACESDAELTRDPLSPAAVNLREIRRDYDRATRLPADLVEQFSQTASIAKNVWAQARQDDDYASFEPWLAKLIDLSRRKAECYGWKDGGEIWDALADGYEPDITAAAAEAVLTPLRDPLAELVDEVLTRGKAPSDRFNDIQVPLEAQRAFVRDVARHIGFDFERGRVAESTHPFCIPLHRDDVRLTTRFHANMLNDALGSTLHESGHAIYNQNVPAGEHVGTPFGSATRLSIHESQSRLIENHVGRSAGFWRWAAPKLRDYFGGAYDGLSFDDLYGGANRVGRGLIRVEADEATYNLHIIVRFELERAMLGGDLSTADLPGAWAERYRKYLGVDVPSDTLGCLQDIHWSQGAFGYFPTYTLGTLYAAQFYDAAAVELGDLDAQFAAGQFEPLITWLNRNIHQHGMRHRAPQLCEQITGRPLSSEPLLRHLRTKLRAIYQL
jgi:carboxypeptidase Taq